MSEHKIPIPSMIYNAAVGGHVTNSQQIIDEDYNLEQKDINKEILGIPYNASNPNGMGKIVLKKNDNFKQVVEAQTNGNTIFVIKYDFTLTDDVTVPVNCVLEFNGGSINGAYTLTGTNTAINAGLVKIFGTDITLTGTWNIEVIYSEWFGAKGNDSSYNDSIAIQKAVDFASLTIRYVQLLNKTYYIANSIVLSTFIKLKGIRGSEIYNGFTKIQVKSEIDAIQVIADDAKNVNIEDIELVGMNRSHYGIHIHNNGADNAIHFSIFKNITITGFDCGMYLDITGINSYNGFSSNIFENIAVHNNHIGFYATGHLGEDGHTADKGVWMNCNYFTNCQFSYNNTGGCCIENMKMFTNNIFDKCLIEANGREYLPSRYSEGVYGLKITNLYWNSYGGNALINTYFENNNPRRTSDTSLESETLVGGTCYPTDFLTNTKVANIILMKTQLSVRDCEMVNSKNVVMLYDAANVELDNISFTALPPISGFTNDRHFIETYTPNIYAKIISKKHTYYYKNLNLSFIYPYIAPSSDTNFRFIKEDTFDGDPCDVSYDNFNKFKIYAGAVSSTDANRFGFYRGLTKSTLANDYRTIISIAKWAIDAGRTIHVQLLGDINSTYASSESTDANVTYPKLHIYSEIGNKKKITTNGGSLLLLGNTEFENCNIDIVNANGGFLFADDRKGYNINFKNVNFEIWKSYNMFWNGNYSVKFDNCIFTWVNNVIKFLYMTDTNLPKIEFNSCSYGKSVNNVIDLYIYNQGDTAHRPKVGKVGQRYFDTTLHKPIFVNAINSTAGITEWIYADGTPVT